MDRGACIAFICSIWYILTIHYAKCIWHILIMHRHFILSVPFWSTESSGITVSDIRDVILWMDLLFVTLFHAMYLLCELIHYLFSGIVYADL